MSQDYLWETATPCAGVNNTLSDKSISDAELSDSANYQPDFTGQGWMIKREGITKQDTNQRTTTTYSIYDGFLNDYYHNGTVVYTIDGTSRVISMASAYDSWATMNLGSTNYDLFVNGTDAQQTSNGTTFSAISGIPSGAKYIAVANNFLYAAGHSGGKIRYSDYGTINTWDATNEIDVSKTIVGMIKCDNALGVWAAKSFYMIMGYSDLDQEISYYSEKDGCTGSHRSIVNTPYGTFWWGLPGIVWMKSGYSIDYPMHRKLAKTLAGLNRSYDSIVHSSWDASQQRIMFWAANGESTTQTIRIDYYPYYDAFYLQTGTGVAMSASASITISGVQNVYVSGYNPTYLFKQSGLTDNTSPITAYLETKREGNPLLLRNGKGINISTDLTGTETITYSAYIDNATAVTKAYAIAIASGSADTYIPLNLANKRIKHRIGDAATATRTRIVSLTHSGQADKIL